MAIPLVPMTWQAFLDKPLYYPDAAFTLDNFARFASDPEISGSLGKTLWFCVIVVGLSMGLGIALATTRLLTSMLFEVSPVDPLTFSITALFLILVGFLACAIPARRASRTDPMVAIRTT